MTQRSGRPPASLENTTSFSSNVSLAPPSRRTLKYSSIATGAFGAWTTGGATVTTVGAGPVAEGCGGVSGGEASSQAASARARAIRANHGRRIEGSFAGGCTSKGAQGAPPGGLARGRDGLGGQRAGLVMVGGINGSGKTTLLELGHCRCDERPVHRGEVEVVERLDHERVDRHPGRRWTGRRAERSIFEIEGPPGGNFWRSRRSVSSVTTASSSKPTPRGLGGSILRSVREPLGQYVDCGSGLGATAGPMGYPAIQLLSRLGPSLVLSTSPRIAASDVPDESFKAAGDIEDAEGFFYRFRACREVGRFPRRATATALAGLI